MHSLRILCRKQWGCWFYAFIAWPLVLEQYWCAPVAVESCSFPPSACYVLEDVALCVTSCDARMLATSFQVNRGCHRGAVSVSAARAKVCLGPAPARPCCLPDIGTLRQVETEWERVLAACRLLEGWVCRGLALGFVAALTLELTSLVADGGQTDFHKSLRLYRAVAGTSLLACAAVYVAAGLLCLGRLKRGALATAPWAVSGLHWLSQRASSIWCVSGPAVLVAPRLWRWSTRPGARAAHAKRRARRRLVGDVLQVEVSAGQA